MGKFDRLGWDDIIKELFVKFVRYNKGIATMLLFLKKFLSTIDAYWTILGWNDLISEICFKILWEKKQEDIDETIKEKC